jgi:hypothetical protein
MCAKGCEGGCLLISFENLEKQLYRHMCEHIVKYVCTYKVWLTITQNVKCD